MNPAQALHTMEWTDITQLNSLIKATEADGAKVEEIGVSGEGRPLYGITIGNSSAPYTVVIIAGCHAKDLPLLSHDPTGLSQVAFSPGFFELSIANGNVENRQSPGSSLAFVAQQFQPQFMGATELPLAVCPALKNGSLLAIDQYNREFQQTGLAQYPFREIGLTMQLSIMQTFIVSVAQCVTAIHT